MKISSTNLLPELPPDTKPLQHQIGGHFYGNPKTKFGILQRCSTGVVLKPFINEVRGKSEWRFYDDVFSDQAPESFYALRPFLAAPLGIYQYNEINYLVLENIVQKFVHPCIADIKIGRITYDFQASKEDIEKCHRRYPPLNEVGFQLLGWQNYNSRKNLYDYHDKTCGRSLTKEEIIYAIAHFYGAPRSDHRKIVRLVLERLTILEHIMTKQQGLVFISSSLLIVYEGENDNEINLSSEPKFDIRVIDLCKVFKVEQYVDQTGLDDNFLYGLRSYMNYLRRLLDDTFVYVHIDKLNCINQ
ncbi:unnamed protein product [Adineta steineri]|uniref:Kinase n=1 Tax=Adineta steineri TaxID=433720 RepID=A0A819ZBR9_9BILA|nr:unnamed protein product [Adineta steineri]CAF3663811.1 unnamed protein product [Adineta steineri]CAF4171645.1 unnamed protein product [Adineta steineri]